MTTLEIILIGIIWVLVGTFVCYKRNWYEKSVQDNDKILFCSFAILFTPITLLIAIFREMILDDWNN